ncbi:LD-carboxypeptidase [Yersinia kristensenii]|uniref:S66 family peptidase n=1 Tax=Yersinia kristensenii TaxID=28152 RepID=UPI001C60DE6B|nr:S66 peptidase family protein [Yersinia kristensenii]MBW5843251.1 LD-carboxypeptidase [Yersinia kristensenii]
MSAPCPLLPPALKIGDTIGFFSASAPATVSENHRFNRAQDYLRAKGFNLQAGMLTGKSDFYRSGSILARAEELNRLIRDPNVNCIMSTIGGYNSNSLLPYIDYSALQANPKIIIGYSDSTALLLGIYARTGLITFYGPALIPSFGEFPPLVDETYNNLAAILIEQPPLPYSYPLPSYWSDERINWNDQQPIRPKTLYNNNCQFIGSNSVSGRVIGGNLNTLSGIWGSVYMPEIMAGDIIFIEDSLKDIATVERSFAMLALNGIFDRVAAIILGKHEGFDDAGSGRTPYDVLKEVLGTKTLPIVNGFDCCHTHPMLTLPLGCQIMIDFDCQQVSLIAPYLK